MAILVTGGTGFVGSNIVCHLAESGEQVVALDFLPSEQMSEALLRRCRGRASIVSGDVRRSADLQRLAAAYPIDAIVHAAALTPRDDEQERQRCQAIVETHVLGTMNILQLARSLPDLRRVIYVSSTSVYGPVLEQADVSEEQPVSPDSLYGITKYACELMGRRWRELFGLDVVSVRLTTVYGPMEHATTSRGHMSIVYAIMRSVIEGKPVRLNALEYCTDWVHAWDVARAVTGLLQARSLAHDLYNISAGAVHSVGEILQILSEYAPALRYSVVAERDADIQVNGAYREGITHNERLKSDLGFEVRFPLREGLGQYVHWLAEANP